MGTLLCRAQVEQSPLFLENEARRQASQAEAVASGQQAQEQVRQPQWPSFCMMLLPCRNAPAETPVPLLLLQRDALRGENMAVEEQPAAPGGEAPLSGMAMDVDSAGGKSK